MPQHRLSENSRSVDNVRSTGRQEFIDMVVRLKLLPVPRKSCFSVGLLRLKFVQSVCHQSHEMRAAHITQRENQAFFERKWYLKKFFVWHRPSTIHTTIYQTLEKVPVIVLLQHANARRVDPQQFDGATIVQKSCPRRSMNEERVAFATALTKT